jgi:hypothetical protein
MKLIHAILGAVVIMLLAGCVSTGQRATVKDGTIDNPSLGFFGFQFEIPEGFELYNPAAKNPSEYSELQQLAIRIYDLNEEIHPRDDERFYESFLLMAENTCFLLITFEVNHSAFFETRFESEEGRLQHQLMPLYNVSETRMFETGETARMEAVWSRGHAYEQKGWVYSGTRRNRMLFNYEACKVTGSKRDGYILMGFAYPEQAGTLASQMQAMIGAMKF